MIFLAVTTSGLAEKVVAGGLAAVSSLGLVAVTIQSLCPLLLKMSRHAMSVRTVFLLGPIIDVITGMAIVVTIIELVEHAV